MFALGVLANHTLSDPTLRIEPRWTLTQIRAALADVEWRRVVSHATGVERYPWDTALNIRSIYRVWDDAGGAGVGRITIEGCRV